MTNAPINLLIAEDDEDDIYLFLQAVIDSKLPVKVTVAKDVLEAVSSLDTILPDVIVIDIILPPSNGIELLEKIKNDERYKHIPVIMFSSLGGVSFVDTALKKGANLYLVKPDTYDMLLQVVQKIYATSLAGYPGSPGTGSLFSHAVKRGFTNQ